VSLPFVDQGDNNIIIDKFPLLSNWRRGATITQILVESS
jgi:hypothetical protein